MTPPLLTESIGSSPTRLDGPEKLRGTAPYAAEHPQNRVDALVKMANQIARQLAYETPDEIARLVAAHINRFWEIDMRADLVAALGDARVPLDDATRVAAGLVNV